jgi:hypothetical protein
MLKRDIVLLTENYEYTDSNGQVKKGQNLFIQIPKPYSQDGYKKVYLSVKRPNDYRDLMAYINSISK